MTLTIDILTVGTLKIYIQTFSILKITFVIGSMTHFKISILNLSEACLCRVWARLSGVQKKNTYNFVVFEL